MQMKGVQADRVQESREGVRHTPDICCIFHSLAWPFMWFFSLFQIIPLPYLPLVSSLEEPGLSCFIFLCSSTQSSLCCLVGVAHLRGCHCLLEGLILGWLGWALPHCPVHPSVQIAPLSWLLLLGEFTLILIFSLSFTENDGNFLQALFIVNVAL